MFTAVLHSYCYHLMYNSNMYLTGVGSNAAMQLGPYLGSPQQGCKLPVNVTNHPRSDCFDYSPVASRIWVCDWYYVGPGSEYNELLSTLSTTDCSQVCASTSGHFNPAVTISLTLLGRFRPIKAVR